MIRFNILLLTLALMATLLSRFDPASGAIFIRKKRHLVPNQDLYPPENISPVWLDELSEEMADCGPLTFRHSNLKSIIETFSFDPHCLMDLGIDSAVFRQALQAPDEVHGFAIGLQADITEVAGIIEGKELAFTKINEETLSLGLLKFSGTTLSLGLTGAGLIKSVIYGKCTNGLNSYLGQFLSVQFLGYSLNYGIQDEVNLWRSFLHPFTEGLYSYLQKQQGPSLKSLQLQHLLSKVKSHMSDCNSLTGIKGPNLPLAGVSQTYFIALEPLLEITGPRVKQMIQFINEINQKRKSKQSKSSDL